jgi:hypothetical protein
MQRIKVETHVLGGGVWFAAWLFTVGYLKLSFGWALLGIIVWPYLLGVHFAPAI